MYDEYEPYENDLLEMSDNEAWADAQADMADYYDRLEDDGPSEPYDCSCGEGYRTEQYDYYGIYAGKMCDECYRSKYKQGPYFDGGYAGESLEPDW